MVADEQYVFKAESKKNLTILLVAGLVLFVIGVFMAMNAGDGHEGGHASVEVTKNLVASTEPASAAAEGGAEHHGSPLWLKRVYTSLWHNNGGL